MKKKSRSLLLDANVVIELFKQGIWEGVVQAYDIRLSQTVAEVEAHFFVTDEGERCDFAVADYAEQGLIEIFEVAVAELIAFRQRFDPSYADRLDPGETESLIYLLDSNEKLVICSADKIVYRVLGNLRMSERGLSLEEVLAAAGLGRDLPYQFTKAYREKWRSKGFEDGMRGMGLDRRQ